jgi:hypothetical protein
MKAAALILAFLFTALAAAPAAAHVVSESNSVWEINPGGEVDLVMTIPDLEAHRLTPDGPPPSDAALIAYLTARIYPLAGGKACALEPPVQAMSAVAGFRKYDFTFKCPSLTNLQIHSAAFFDLVASHTNYAEIQNVATGQFTQDLITRANQTVDVIGGAGGALKQASFWDFIGMGIMHIFTGVDHMSFLVGLVLISRRLRDLIFVVTGFTIGHSLTLALAVTGVIRPHAEFIDALVALTIALIGAENLAVESQRPGIIALCLGLGSLLMIGLKMMGYGTLPTLLLLGAGLFTANYLMVSGHIRDAGRLRMVITLVFGLIHGFGFAASLLEMQLPPERLAELLVGFNLGVEIGQLTLVLAVTGLALALTKMKLAPPRAIVVELASSCLVGLGVFWFVSRSFG